MNKIIGIIPVRSGSKRVPHKNFLSLGGLPLYMRTAFHATQSGIFDEIFISSDTIEIIETEFSNMKTTLLSEKITLHKRPEKFCQDYSNDCEWIEDIFNTYGWDICSHYMILRPTNPFRTFGTITRAYNYYKKIKNYDISLKSITPEFNGSKKLWIYENINFNDIKKSIKYCSENDNIFMKSFLEENKIINIPFFEQQTDWREALSIGLSRQNGCIDICPVTIIKNIRNRYIGDKIIYYRTNDLESLDINTQFDYFIAQLIFHYSRHCNSVHDSFKEEINFFNLDKEYFNKIRN